jgi:hypothetical protein
MIVLIAIYDPLHRLLTDAFQAALRSRSHSNSHRGQQQIRCDTDNSGATKPHWE